MIELYGWAGPNPRKITILLEELEVPYNFNLVDVYAGEHRQPDFLAINPNGRTPALVDPEGQGGPITLWESGAILIYLAERFERFLPATAAARYDVLRWTMFQMSHAPYLGNAHIYRLFLPEPMEFDIIRFTTESARIYGVLDEQLKTNEFIAASGYSIADMAWWPWIEYHDWQGQDLADFPNLLRWFETVGARDAVQRGRAVPWKKGEFGEGSKGSEMGKMMWDLAEERKADPRYSIPADFESPIFQLINGASLGPSRS
jgi:GSH-dependent disulfide-bond oxidoreductase